MKFVPTSGVSPSKRRQQFLTVARWLLLAVPICYVGILAMEQPFGAAPLHPRVWFQLLFGGAVLSFPGCVVVVFYIARLVGLRSVAQQSYVVGAAVVGYITGAYLALLGKVEIAPDVLHVDGIDAVFAALLNAPIASLLFGAAMMAVVQGRFRFLPDD